MLNFNCLFLDTKITYYFNRCIIKARALNLFNTNLPIIK